MSGRDLFGADHDATIRAALCILEARARHGRILGDPGAVRDLLRLKLAEEPREHFAVAFLDTQNRLTAWEIMFSGTLSQTSVYPREVVKAALRHNAAAVILAHNHPSGVAEPSHADQSLTETLRRALALVEVRILDHFVVTLEAATSFAERGLL